MQKYTSYQEGQAFFIKASYFYFLITVSKNKQSASKHKQILMLVHAMQYLNNTVRFVWGVWGVEKESHGDRQTESVKSCEYNIFSYFIVFLKVNTLIYR